MNSWFFRRFRSVRKHRVSITGPRVTALEDRLTPAMTFAPLAPFASTATIPNPASWHIVVGDFDGNGTADFASDSGQGANQITTFIGAGAGVFNLDFDLDQFWTIQPNSLVVGDFTDPTGGAPDGLDDYAYLSPDFADIDYISRDTGGLYFLSGVPPVDTTTRISMGLGDFNNDGAPDFVLGRNSAAEYEIQINNKDATLTAIAKTASNGLTNIVLAPKVADIDGDGNLDFVAVNSSPVSGKGRAGVYYGSGDGKFTSGSILKTSQAAGVSNFAIGDFDGDGQLDVITVTGSKFEVFFQTTPGVFPATPSTSFTSPAAPRDLAVGDFDSDGIDDLAITSSDTADANVHIYLGSATKTITGGAGFTIPTAGQNAAIAAIDGNNNGVPDLLVSTQKAGAWSFQYLNNTSVVTGPIISKIKLSETPNPVAFGQPVTFTATVKTVAVVPTGTVTFNVNGVDIGSAPLDASGTAIFVYTPPPFLPIGKNPVIATYTGDAIFLPGTATNTLVVNPIPAGLGFNYTSIFPPVPPGNAGSVFGANVTMNASVTILPGFDPTGEFQFFANGKLLGSVPVDPVTGAGVFITPAIAVGNNQVISVTYTNDPIYATTSLASTTLLDVTKLPTVTTITSTSNPSVYGEPVQYFIQVSPDPSVAAFVTPVFSGEVALSDNDNTIAVLNIDATGFASYTVPPNYALGNHIIFAVYPGTNDANKSVSASFTQVVNKADSTNDLTVDFNAITFGETITLTSTVSINSPGIGTPSGTVTFRQDGAPIAVVPVNSLTGLAQFTVTGLTAGSYVFNSTFSGNTNVNGSVSIDVPVTVAPTTSTTVLTVTPSTIGLGAPFDLKATVTDGKGGPVTVGTVTFSGTFNGSALPDATVNVVNGLAQYTFIDFLPFGSGQWTASYTGTPSIGDSAAGPVDFNVVKADAAVFLSTNVPTTQPFGTSVPFFVTLIPPGSLALPITGTVDFFDNGVLFDTQPVANGMALSSRNLTLGTHEITAVYNGDANYATAAPAGITFNIFRPTDRFSVGAGPGGPDRVNVFDAAGNVVFSPLFAFSPDHTAGVRVATADFDGDGVQDVVMGTGPGTGSRVRILSGVGGAPIFDFSPFGEKFTGGVYVAAGDVNGDFRPDLVVTPDRSGGARVRVLDGTTFNTMADFFAIIDGTGQPDLKFRGGARASVGDINGDGFGDVVVAAGFGGGPRIATFNGAGLSLTSTPKLFGDFLAFENTLRNGAFVAVGDINGDGLADIAAGAGPGGGPRVTLFDGASLLNSKEARISDFFAGDVNNRGGVPVALRFLDSDDQLDLIVGTGPGSDLVTAYLGKNLIAVNTAPPPFLKFNAFSNTPDPDDAFRGTFVG